jgi:hypothetical protein
MGEAPVAKLAAFTRFRAPGNARIATDVTGNTVDITGASYIR